MNNDVATRNELLAVELYELTIAAKSVNVKWFWGRRRMAKMFSQMQYLLHAMSLERITDSRADAILRAIAARGEKFEWRFREAEPFCIWTEPQKDLLLTMHGIVQVCIPVLLYKQGEYVGTLRCSIGALHNLARAFLPVTDYMHLSVDDAMENARPYWRRFG